MARELDKLRDDLLALPTKSRASLAHSLIASLDDGEDVNAERLWIEEIRRRERALRLGKATARPAREVLREAREKLRCMK